MLAMKISGKIFLLLSTLSLTGCFDEITNTHESFSDGSGVSYILNKATGTVYRLEEGQLVELEKLRVSDLASKSFGPVAITKDSLIEARVAIRYESGNLFYRLEIRPLFIGPESTESSENRKQRWQYIMENAITNSADDAFTVKLTDAQGFVLEIFPVSLGELQATSDHNGVWGYDGLGDRSLQLSKYLQIKGWDIRYPWSVDKGV